MRYGLLLFAILARAQQADPRGFVNERLLRRDFAKTLLPAPRIKPLPLKPPAPLAVKPQKRFSFGKAQNSSCAIPLLGARISKNADPKMARHSGNRTDEKMILPTIPVCPAPVAP